MILYANGDSNTAGTDLSLPKVQGFVAKLGEHLGAGEIINHAIPGASNSKILRTTEEYLRTCAAQGKYPDLMVIGWSEFAREDWFINGEYQSLNSFDLAIPEKIDDERYKYWKNQQGYNQIYRSQIPKFWNTAIHNLHIQLKSLGVPHLFFNAIESFNAAEEQLLQTLDDSVDWGKIYQHNWQGNYFRPYDTSMAMIVWAQAAGYKEIREGKYHFPEPAQTAWTKILYDHIKENNII